MTKIGLALSGGGARCLAHIGVLKALDEHNIKPSIISATSGGAVVGAYYASGYPPEEILNISRQIKVLKYLRPALRTTGFFTLETIQNLFQEHLPATFRELNIPLIIGTTNLKAGDSHYFSQGPLIRPMIASCSIPVFFAPVKIEGVPYVDGGVINNMPVEPLVGHCDKIIGVHTNPVVSGLGVGSIRKIAERSFLISIRQNVLRRATFCDILVEPIDLGLFRVYDFKKAKEMYEIGYLETIKRMGEIKKVLEKAD